MSLTDVEAAASPAEIGAAPEISGRSPWALAVRRLRRDKVAVISAIILIIMVLLALLAPLIAHWTGHQPNFQDRKYGTDVNGLPVSPRSRFWFGTDNIGRDVFIRTLYGARVSLLVGVLATAVATTAGVAIGLITGYIGGIVDNILARFIDVVLSFPYLIFAIALVAVIGPSLTLTIAVIAFFSWASMARVVRGQVLAQKEKEYVEAARSLGASSSRIMFLDLLPNVLAPVIVLASLLIPVSIVFEATLSYLGMGVPLPTASWGNMLASAQNIFETAWWFLFFPTIFLLITTVCFNLLGDAVRDALDPRTERLFARQAKKKKKNRTAGGAAPASVGVEGAQEA